MFFCVGLKKNLENIWWFQKIVVPLHHQTRSLTPKTFKHYVFCNVKGNEV